MPVHSLVNSKGNPVFHYLGGFLYRSFHYRLLFRAECAQHITCRVARASGADTDSQTNKLVGSQLSDYVFETIMST
jgi:hypothetical protein